MLNDLRLALRSLCKSPGFTVIAIVTLALGIGAGTAIFSVVNGVLLRPLSYPRAERLMQVETVFESGKAGNLSYADFEDLRRQNRTFAGLAAYADWTATGAAEGSGFLVHSAEVSPGFLSVLGVAPAAGRAFSAEDERIGARVALVSYGYWRSRLAARDTFENRSIRVNGETYAVIGVMPRGFDFPSETELWVPRQPVEEDRTAHNWRVVGRLRDGVSRSAAQEDLSTLARRLKQQYGGGSDMVDADVRPVLEQLVGRVRPALSVLLGAAGILLLVACVNVANLVLARSLSRDRESALRLALGAHPARLARIFLAESLALSLAGAGLGLAVARAGVPALLALEPGRLPRIQDIGVDSRVLAFSLAAAVLTAVAVGLLPGLRAARRDTRDVLVASRGIRGRNAAGHGVRAALVAGQIALTVVLLVGAGLLGRSFMKLLAVDPGYRTSGALVMDIWHPAVSLLEAPGSSADMRIATFTERLMTRIRALPGVERVGGIDQLPLRSGGPTGTFLVLQRADEVASFEDYARLAAVPARTGNAEFLVASPEYFGAMGIPLVRGRFFDDRDTIDAPHSAVISASLAATRWPGEDPLGKLIQFGGMDGDLRPLTIVGVVGDVQERSLGSRPRPMFYVDYRQRPRKAYEFHIVIQGAFDAAATAAAARRISREFDPEVPVDVETLESIVSTSLGDRRFVLLLAALFGGLALVLATAGIYGVVAYMASQRTAEIGVRVALGARGGDVVRLLVRQGVVFASVGIAAGIAAAAVLTRVLASFLYDVGTIDPATFAAAAGTLFAAAVAASWIPAHRAARIDAIEALRHE